MTHFPHSTQRLRRGKGGGHGGSRTRTRSDDALLSKLLEVPETQRETWIEAHTLGRPALRERLVALERLGSNSLHTGGAITALESAALPERIGPYRILRAYWSRGNGGGFSGPSATAGQFSRTVAIKVIKPGLFTPELVSRSRANGRPWRGSAIRTSRSSSTAAKPSRARLTLSWNSSFRRPCLAAMDRAAPRSKAERTQTFLDICSAAAAFRRRRIVVHRDLTPNQCTHPRQ